MRKESWPFGTLHTSHYLSLQVLFRFEPSPLADFIPRQRPAANAAVLRESVRQRWQSRAQQGRQNADSRDTLYTRSSAWVSDTAWVGQMRQQQHWGLVERVGEGDAEIHETSVWSGITWLPHFSAQAICQQNVRTVCAARIASTCSSITAISWLSMCHRYIMLVEISRN